MQGIFSTLRKKSNLTLYNVIQFHAIHLLVWPFGCLEFYGSDCYALVQNNFPTAPGQLLLFTGEGWLLLRGVCVFPPRLAITLCLDALCVV